MTGTTVRPYNPRDRNAVRKICGDTGFYGQAIERLLEDRDLVVEALIGYYTDFEPESLFVAEKDGQVVGYLAGCVDTKRFERIFARRILPRLIARFITRGHWHSALSWKVLMSLGRGRQRLLRSIVDTYPAHCHMNIDAGSRRGGTGSLLFARFLSYLEERNVTCIHVSTASKPGKAFFIKKGFSELGRYDAPSLPVETPAEILLLGRKLTE